MATDPTTVPSVADLQKTKKYMDNIDNFVSSGNDTLTDADGVNRKTLTGIENEADKVMAEKSDEFDQVIDQYKESRGFNTKGTFAAGFTYELPNDVGLDADGNPWILIDTSSLPVTVTAGTTPTNPPYKQVAYGTAAQVSTNTSDTVQSFVDSFALKIFQSPTDGGLTEIQTRTVNAGEVYEVRKTSDDSLATIYSDATGTTEIVQNGTSNVSDSAGVVEFYIVDGRYNINSNGKTSEFIASKSIEIKTDNITTASNLTLLVGDVVEIKSRNNSKWLVRESLVANNLDVIEIQGGLFIELIDKYRFVNWIDSVDSGAESSDALQSYINFLKSTGKPVNIDMGNGTFITINKPIKGTWNCTISGNAIIRATSDFQPIQFDLFGGGTIVLGTMLWFAETAPTTEGSVATLGSGGVSRRFSLSIEKSVVLDCRDYAGYGVILDSYVDFDINCEINSPTKWGVRTFSGCWTGAVNGYIHNMAEGGIWLGSASNGIDMTKARIWGENKVPTISGILIDGDNNGCQLGGATVEKVQNGIICRNGAGPLDISGVDFEQIEDNLLVVDGTGLGGRTAGPVTISGSFLETNSATEAIIKAINAKVIVEGCRVRNAAKLFDISGVDSVGVNRNNEIADTVLSLGNGNIITEEVSSRALKSHAQIGAGQALENTREVYNFNYGYDTSLVSSGLSFEHAVTSLGNETMVGNSEWFVNYSTGGANAGTCGIKIDYQGGGSNKYIVPLSDLDTTLGRAGYVFKSILTSTLTLPPRSSSGTQANNLFVDSSDGLLKFRDNSGVVRVVNLT